MKNSELNKKFLSSVTPEMKSIILSNIANHYGITEEEAENEITDEEAENVMEYITGSDRMAIYMIYKKTI